MTKFMSRGPSHPRTSPHEILLQRGPMIGKRNLGEDVIRIGGGQKTKRKAEKEDGRKVVNDAHQYAINAIRLVIFDPTVLS